MRGDADAHWEQIVGQVAGCAKKAARGKKQDARGKEDWYYRARRLLPAEVWQHRMQSLDEIIAALVKASAYQKRTYKKT